MNDEAKTWLTPEAYEKLEEELRYLTTDKRAELEQRIAEAREHGDFRENAEYEAAKDEQGIIEARIRHVQATLDNAEVAEVEDNGAVTVGTVATVVDDDGDELEFFVAPAENKVQGMILASPESPLGAALLGARPGEKVRYEAPGGTFTYRVLAIRIFEG